MTDEERPRPPAPLLRWGSWFYLALALGGVLWIGLRRGAIPLELFVDRDAWPADAAIGLAGAGILVGLWHLGRLALPSARALEVSMAEIIGPLSSAEIVALSALSGFSEELFFRGAVQSQWGIVPATVIFALLHVGPGKEFRLWTAFALVAGAGLGGLMLWRGNLLAPVLAHAAVNLWGLRRLAGMARTAAPAERGTTRE